MRLSLVKNNISEISTDLLVLCAFEGQLGNLPVLKDIDHALNGQLTKIIEKEVFTGKKKESLLIHTFEQMDSSSVLLLGLGKHDDFQIPDTRNYAARAILAAQKSKCKSMAIALPPLSPSAHEIAVQFLAEGIWLKSYQFESYKSKTSRNPIRLETVKIIPGNEGSGSLDLSLARAKIISDSVIMARNLVNEPASSLTPSSLAQIALKMATECGIECKILGKNECEKKKMNLFLAVSQGSDQAPQFIHLKYRPKGKEKPKYKIVLVGKGITFDSGGLSLKPSASMVDMKGDMAGAATVLGVMQAISSLGLKNCEVHGLIAAAENMVSGSAYRVSDIFTGMAGKSVEIINTDAEGRLTLADALSYALKLSPNEIIDVATLTGACVVALGPHMAGLMGNDLALIEKFLACSRKTGEEVWHLPLPERLKDQLKSPVADLKNVGDRWGGALTAGLFLKEFVDHVPWIHLDIAGPAFADKAWGHISKGGTGFGVSSIVEYLFGHSQQ